MTREQREHIVYAGCDLIRHHLGTITEVFIESNHWRATHPDQPRIHTDEEIHAAAEALGKLEQRVKELKTG